MDIEELIKSLRGATSAVKRKTYEERLRAFLKSHGSPIVIADKVHFFLEHDTAIHVSIVGDWNGWDHSSDVLTRLNRHSAFFYREVTLPIDGRYAYRFVIDATASINDPLNRYIEQEVFGANTVVRMPGYRVPEYSEEPLAQVLRGKLREIEVSRGRSEDDFSRKVTAYIPAGVRRLTNLPVLYIHDGAEMITVGRINDVLDNLFFYEPHLPKCVVVLIPPVQRNSEYMLNADFAGWIAHTLVPKVEATLKITATPERRGTMGASLGGLLSAQLGLVYPRLFGNIVSQSPAFWVKGGKMIDNFKKIRQLPLRWFLHTGNIHDAEEETRKMLAVLNLKGYDVAYRETQESHNWANWRGQYADIIRWFVRREQKVVNLKTYSALSEAP